MTQEEIVQAAEALEARGERASVRKVRAELGGGDPGTIARALKARREGDGAVPQEQMPDVPEGVLRVLTGWACQVATVAAAEASAALATVGEDNEAILGQIDDLQKELAALQAELEATKSEAASMSGQLKAALDAAEQAVKERDEARAKADGLGKQLVAMETKIAAADAAKAEIDALRGENKELIARAATAEASLKAALDAAERAEGRAKQFAAETAEARERAGKSFAEMMAAKTLADELKTRLMAAEGQTEKVVKSGTGKTKAPSKKATAGKSAKKPAKPATDGATVNMAQIITDPMLQGRLL